MVTSFGSSGVAQLPVPGSSGQLQSLNRMVVQPDGKILVGALDNSHDTVVYRLNADGSLDTTFGAPNGYIVDTHALTSSDASSAIGEDAAGRVYVGGGMLDANNHSELYLSRYDASGGLDTSFGSGGTTAVPQLVGAFGANPVNDHITDLTPGPNGTMLASAWVGQGGGADFVVLRFLDDGSLDPAFGNSGYASADFHGGDDTARSLALQSDGRIVVAGFAKSADSGPDNVGLARFTAGGALDTTFGTNGETDTDFSAGGADGAWSVDVSDDNTISVAATAYTLNKAVVGRYTANGVLETSFNSTNNTGKGLGDTFGATSASAFSVTHDSDGRLLVAGPANVSVATSATSPGVDRLVDASYPLDTTWNSTGRALLGCTNAANVGGAVATTAAGDVLTSYSCGGKIEVGELQGGNDVPVGATVVGGAASYNQFTLANVNANGSGTTTARVAPGATFTVSLDYTQTQSQTSCPGCIDQIQLGFPNDYPSQCAYDSTVAGGSVSGSYSGSFVAPTKRGTYYIGAQANQLFHCLDAGWTSQPGPSLYIAKVIVGGVTSISVDADRSTAPAGHLRTPTSSIPGTALQAAGADIQAAPLRSTPLRSTPLRSTPLRSTPLRSTPLRSTPLRSTPLRSTAIDIPLSDAPLVSPKTWTDVLNAPASAAQYEPNPYAGTPLQTVTLHEVLSLPAGEYPAVDALTMDDIDWSQVSEVRNLSLAAFLLGDTPLSHLPAPSGGWCGYLSGPLVCGSATAFPDSHSLADVQLAGDDVSSYLSTTDIPLGNGSGLVGSPLPGMVLADLELSMTTYSNVPAGSFATCTNSCSLSGAQSDGTLNVSATLGDLLADASMPAVSLGDVLPGIIPASELPYDQVPLATVIRNSSAPSAGDLVTYTVRAGLDCVSPDTLSIGVQLPPGFEYQDSSAALDVDGTSVTPLTVTDGAQPVSFAATTAVLTRINSVIVTAPVNCTGASHATLTLEVEPGVELGGPFTTVATASFEQSRLSTTGAPVTVVDQQPPAQSAIDTIYLGHVSQPGDVDQYTISGGATGFAPGSQITASLTNIPSGQDFDLVAFGPAAPDLRSSPLRSTPLRSTPLRSTAVTDTSLDPQSDGTSAAPDPEADVPTTPPAGETFLASSRNRGSTSDSLALTVGDGETGDFTLQVSGYNGSWDTSPYMLRISVTPPAGQLPCATLVKPGNGTAGSLPSTPLPTTTKTLILVNQQRLGDFYSSTDADRVMTSLQSFATDNDGVVVPIEGDPDVAAAYAAWDNEPCSPAAADDVVAKINALVDRLRTGLADLRYVVIVGNDQIVPFARVADHTAVSNERDYGAAAFDGHDNAISRALTDGYLLTDDAYSSFNPTPWLDSALYVPNVATGRLVETPTDIVNALTAFHDSGGVRRPSAAYTTGYDFMTSEADAINSALSHNLGTGGTAAADIGSSWTKADAVAGIDAAPAGILSVNAHYDNYRALPADQFTAGTQSQLLSTADLPTSMAGSIMFTIGCHAGLNLADTFVASPTAAQTAKLLDWSQAVSSKGGQFIGNTGFGYGDTDTIAYSAALMVQLAKNLDGSMTVGQALMYAKQAYLHLPMGVYDAKAMEEATFYGLPMYTLGSAGHEAAPALPDTSTPSSTAPAVAGAPLSVDIGTDGSTQDAQFVARSQSNGTYYVVHHVAAGIDDPPLVLQNEPIEPQTTVPVPKPASGPQTAHGISLDELSTYATSTGGFDPVFDKPSVVGTFTHEPGINDAFFPATIDGLVSQQTPTGPADVAVVTPGTFRSGSGAGVQTLASHMKLHVNYSDSDQFEPPTVDSTDGIVTSPGNASFTVHVHGVDRITRVTVLFLPQQVVGTPTAWTEVDLHGDVAGTTWTGSSTFSTSLATVGQYIVQATDASGNVTESANKGRDFSAVPPPASDLNAPVISPSGPEVNGVFTEAPNISINGRGPLKYSLDNAPFQTYAGPFTVTADGTHLITAKDADGVVGARVVVVETSPPAVTITAPANGATYLYGDVPTPVFTCTSPTAIKSCTPSPTPPTQNVGTTGNSFAVTATDSAERTTTATVNYFVAKRSTTTTVSCTSPVLAGQANTTTCTATVADASLTSISTMPTGTVTFTSASPAVVSDGGSTHITCALSTSAGVTSCTASLPALARGTSAINASYGGDAIYLGSQTTSAATAKVWEFAGFLQPINDGPGTTASVFKYGSTVPAKFQLRDETGTLVPDSVALAMVDPTNCKAKFSFTATGASVPSVDETALSTTPDTGNCFRYDSTAHQFIFNVDSKKLTKNTSYRFIATLSGTVTGSHYVVIGTR